MALLHDVTDDTVMKPTDVEQAFGPEVAEMVRKVSQLSTLNQLLRRRKRQEVRFHPFPSQCFSLSHASLVGGVSDSIFSCPHTTLSNGMVFAGISFGSETSISSGKHAAAVKSVCCTNGDLQMQHMQKSCCQSNKALWSPGISAYLLTSLSSSCSVSSICMARSRSTESNYLSAR